MSCAYPILATIEQSLNISRTEPDLHLRRSLSQTVHVRVNATSDTLVVLPFSTDLRNRTIVAMIELVGTTSLGTFYANAFWSKDTSNEISLVMFASTRETKAYVTGINWR
jgi:hypothetical protein